jgi:hypothetical protein
VGAPRDVLDLEGEPPLKALERDRESVLAFRATFYLPDRPACAADREREEGMEEIRDMLQPKSMKRERDES